MEGHTLLPFQARLNLSSTFIEFEKVRYRVIQVYWYGWNLPSV